VDIGTARLVARLLVLPSLFLTFFAAAALSAVLPVWLAVVIACAVVGPSVHFVVGELLDRRRDPSDGMGGAITVTGLAYPVVLWLGGTIYVGATRSLWQAALVFVTPAVVLVAAAVVFDTDRRPARAGRSDRRAIADQRGWPFVADGTEVLEAHWAAYKPDPRIAITATSVLVGDIDGWPVTICDVAGRRGLGSHPVVTCVVHLPIALPRTVASPSDNPLFGALLRGTPWTTVEREGEQPVREVHLISEDPTFADRLATPELRRATLDGDLMYWRINGRDLSIARQARGRPIPGDEVLRTAYHLVALARTLPADVVDAYGTPPDQGVPFREPSRHDHPGGPPRTT